MSTSSSVLSQTLQEITNTKLGELSKRHANYENAKSTLLSSLPSESDPISRLGLLADAVKKSFGIKLDKSGVVLQHLTRHPGLEVELKNLDRFLAQARHDPSISPGILAGWEASLVGHLERESLRFRYASLYGQLVTEWLSAEQGGKDKSDGGEDTGMTDDFEDLTDALKKEARKDWEKSVFTPAEVDEAALSSYLANLFGTANPQKERISDALDVLRGSVEQFENELAKPGQFTKSTLTWAINGLISSGLLTDEKREVLNDFKNNQVILAEVADVLNMRLAALDTWSWGDAVALEQRRKISGIYNIHMHEDLLQAVFLQHIGVKWSVFFKKTFKEFLKADGAWKPMAEVVPLAQKRRLEHYLGHTAKHKGSLMHKRQKMHAKHYFMAQLPGDEYGRGEGEEGEEEVEYAQALMTQQNPVFQQAAPVTNRFMMARQSAPTAMMQRAQMSSTRMRNYAAGGAKRHRRIVREDEISEESEYSDDEDEDDKPKTPLQLKQRVLHLLATEIAVNTKLHGELTAFHSVFERWNPLLPHETILTVLKFLGVSDTWLGFFGKFLRAPLKFLEDGDDVGPRERRRGTPAAHALSDLFGETVFFCLDFAVNQETSGKALWRVHDAIWFWSPDHNTSVKAWDTVQAFVKATGVTIDGNKTGSVRVSADPDTTLPIDKTLPQGQIRWGFLALSPQTGRFEIDQTLVDSHITELRKQLSGEGKSVFAFIQAWNGYAATFFTTNFGIPANCFGRDHVDNMLATHQRIQRQVFSGSPRNSVVDHLKEVLSTRFGVEDVPEGYFYFPAELGGLDLKSPFISLLQIRDAVVCAPEQIFDRLDKTEREGYERARNAYLAGKHSRKEYSPGDTENSDVAPAAAVSSARGLLNRERFISFEEYVQYREQFRLDHTFQIHHAFEELMKKPEEQALELDSAKLGAALGELAKHQGGHHAGVKGIRGNWGAMDPYWKWVAVMYGPEIVERFGGLNIVDSGMLPIGMVSIYRDRRVKWEG